MFFTKAGQVIAWVAVVVGLSMVFMGFYAAKIEVPTSPQMTTGMVIDRGIYIFIFGVIVGVLTDISKSVAKLKVTE